MTIIFDEIYKSFPQEPCVSIYGGNAEYLLIRKVELLNSIFIKDFECFQNRAIFAKNESRDPINANLLNLSGPQWRNTRAKIMSLFQPGMLKRMFPLVRDSVDDLDDHFDECARTGRPADVKHVILDYVIDVMGKYAFGLKLDTVKNPDASLRKFGRARLTFPTVTKRIGRILLRWIHPAIVRRLPFKVIGSEVENTFLKLWRDAMERNGTGGTSPPNFLKLLADIQNQEKRNGIAAGEF